MANARIVILGIDPGTRHMGFGWLEFSSEEPETLLGRGCGVIEPKANDSLEGRLGLMLDELERIFASRRPSYVVIENVFLGKNVSSALVLGQARGLVLAVAGRNDSMVREVATKTAKKSVTGRGDANKEDVRLVLDRVLDFNGELFKLPLDASDALALAYHGWREQIAKSLLRGEVQA